MTRRKKKVSKQISESDIQRECLLWLKANGFLAWKNHVGAIRVGKGVAQNPAKGSPDILAIRGGQFFGVEVKKPGGKVAEHQIAWADKARKFGAIILFIRSLQELIDDMAQYESVKPMGFDI